MSCQEDHPEAHWTLLEEREADHPVMKNSSSRKMMMTRSLRRILFLPCHHPSQPQPLIEEKEGSLMCLLLYSCLNQQVCQWVLLAFLLPSPRSSHSPLITFPSLTLPLPFSLQLLPSLLINFRTQSSGSLPPPLHPPPVPSLTSPWQQDPLPPWPGLLTPLLSSPRPVNLNPLQLSRRAGAASSTDSTPLSSRLRRRTSTKVPTPTQPSFCQATRARVQYNSGNSSWSF